MLLKTALPNLHENTGSRMKNDKKVKLFIHKKPTKHFPKGQKHDFVGKNTDIYTKKMVNCTCRRSVFL